MPTHASPSAALPLAHLTLRILIVVNWLWAAAIVVLLVAMPNREWILSALDLSPSLEADKIVTALRVVALLGLIAIALNYLVLRRLQAMVDTVRAGDPFVAANAARLQAIAWSLLVLQVIGMLIEMIARSISTPAHPVDLDTGFSINGWLAVLLTFLLARVFTAGTAMRDDLEGTV
jgi:Protein of unknown function (DUF2975)